MKTVLGIDPGTNLSVAVARFGSLTAPAFKLTGSEVEKARQARSRVRMMVGKYKPDLAVIEGYAFGNRFSLVSMAAIGTMVRDGLIEEDCALIEVAPSMLKKYATGKGNAKKDQIMLAVYKSWGRDFETSDQADAAVLAMIGLALIGAVEPETEYRRKVIEELRKANSDVVQLIALEKS